MFHVKHCIIDGVWKYRLVRLLCLEVYLYFIILSDIVSGYGLYILIYNNRLLFVWVSIDFIYQCFT